jgi:membrane protease YdiL (CAAX protease family)
MRISSLIARAPLRSYFILAFSTYLFGPLLFAVHATIFPIYDSETLVLVTVILGSWVPTLAAIIVTGVLAGRAGVADLLRGFLKWRLPLWCYLVALLPIVFSGLSAALYSAFGFADGPYTLTLRSLLGVFLLSVVAGAAGEEAGWRGFALPRLQARFGPLVGTLVLGVIWAVWHVQAWFTPESNQSQYDFWAFAIWVVSITVIMTWLFNRSGGSLLLAFLFHFCLNFALDLLGRRVGLVGDPRIFMILNMCVVTAAALIVVIATRGRLGYRPEPAPSAP